MAAHRGSGTVSVDIDPNGETKVCVYNDRNVGSNGAWFGDYPFYFTIPVTLIQVFLVVAASQVLYLILRPLRTPKFVCSALGGMVMGPSVLGRNKKFREHFFLPRQTEFLVVAAAIGFIYSVFIVALKMEVAMTLRTAKRTWKLGIIPFLVSFFVMLGLFRTYSPDDIPGIKTQFGRIVLSINSSFNNFAVISQLLLDLNLITSELGQIALSSSMANDVIHAAYIAGMYLVRSKGGKRSVTFILFCHWVFMCSCIFIIRPAMMMIATRTPAGKPIKKGYVVMILTGVLVAAFVSEVLGLSYLYGPMFFGLVMPNGPPLGTTIIESTEIIVSQFFLPLAFAYIGLQTDLFAITNWGMILKIHFLVVAGYLAKLLTCMLMSLTYKIRLKHGIVLGLILNLKGIVELAICGRMEKMRMIDNQIFSFLMFYLLGTTAIIAPLVELLYKPHTRLDTFSKHHRIVRTIQNTPRTSEFCIISCVHNEGNVRSIISLIEACNPVLENPIFVYVIHLIELLGKSTPFLLPVDKHRSKSTSFNCPITNQIMRAFENYSYNSDAVTAVQSYINVAPYKNMHEAVCNLAQDKLVPFLLIPFHENDQARGSLMTNSIRDLNTNFQTYAPCTVGILVDRFSQLSMNTSAMSVHVGIFFVGGPDDRETLALGMRMSERENMRVTLFWFVLNSRSVGVNKSQIFYQIDDEDEEEEERIMDESFIDEFRAKNIGNPNVVCRDIMVEDGVGVLEAIRSLEGNYDLVMVGRRHNMGTLNDKEMSYFVENVEMLGIYGDMLASTEFCNGMVPVLVLRCGGTKPPVDKLSRVGSVMASHKSFAN